MTTNYEKIKCHNENCSKFDKCAKATRTPWTEHSWTVYPEVYNHHCFEIQQEAE